MHMDILKSYNSVINDKSLLMLENNIINEQNNNTKYQLSYKKLMKKIDIDLYYISKYNIAISAIYPFVYELIRKNSYANNNNVILITICAISATLQDEKVKLEKLFKFANDNKINTLDIDNLISQIESVFNIYKIIANNFNKDVIYFNDMLEQVDLFIPFMNVLTGMLKNKNIEGSYLKDKLDIENDNSSLLLHRIMHKLIITLGAPNKIQNKENVRPLIINDEFKSPTISKKQTY
jgi:hypothetical protein